MIDSTDSDRLPEAKEELHRIMKEDSLDNSLLLVLANKQGTTARRRARSGCECAGPTSSSYLTDMPKALSVEEITEGLELASLNKKWHIVGTCATTGEGMPLSLLVRFLRFPCGITPTRMH